MSNNLLLIDKNIEDKEFIISSLLSNSIYIILDPVNETYDSIYNKIKTLNVQSFNNIAIVKHNDGKLFNVNMNDPNLLNSANIYNFRDFLVNLKNNFGMMYFDIISCNSYDYNWKKMIYHFKSDYGLFIRASSDIIGYNGNWFLDSDNVDLVNLYFNSEIKKYLYYLLADSHINIADISGNIWSSGWNNVGQLAVGSTTTTPSSSFLIASTMPTGKKVKQLATGIATIFALMEDNTVYSCGWNNYGQLGLGNNNNQTTFQQVTVPVGKTVKQIACGYYHTIMLMTDGSLYSCGSNTEGQLARGSTTTSNTLATNISFGLCNNSTGQIPYQVACGDSFTVILMMNGDVYSCGSNSFGTLGVGDGYLNSSSLMKMFFSLNRPNHNIRQVSCGNNHVIMLGSDNKIFGCGKNSKYQLGLSSNTNSSTPQEIPNTSGLTPIQIGCGNESTIMLMNDVSGSLYCCGQNPDGRFGTNVTQYIGLTLLTKSSIGITDKIPIQICHELNLTILLMNDGTAWVAGKNNYGQLGVGDTNDRYVFTQMKKSASVNMTNVTTLPTTYNYSYSEMLQAGYPLDYLLTKRGATTQKIYLSNTQFTSMYLKANYGLTPMQLFTYGSGSINNNFYDLDYTFTPTEILNGGVTLNNYFNRGLNVNLLYDFNAKYTVNYLKTNFNLTINQINTYGSSNKLLSNIILIVNNYTKTEIQISGLTLNYYFEKGYSVVDFLRADSTITVQYLKTNFGLTINQLLNNGGTLYDLVNNYTSAEMLQSNLNLTKWGCIL